MKDEAAWEVVAVEMEETGGALVVVFVMVAAGELVVAEVAWEVVAVEMEEAEGALVI